MEGANVEAVKPKAQKTIFHFFKQQSQVSVAAPVVKVRCPACYLEVPESKINWHLDQDCSSKTKPKKKKDQNLVKRKKILKSVKKQIVEKETKKFLLSDDEADADEVEVLVQGDETGDEDEPYISSSMVETRIFELDGEINCNSSSKDQNSSPIKLKEVVTSPYFSPNSKHAAGSPTKCSEKIIDFQIPSTSNNCISMLEADWKTPPSTPVKNGVVVNSDLEPCRDLKNLDLKRPESCANSQVREMLEKDWNCGSPTSTPKRLSLRKSNPDLTKSDDKDVDFDQTIVKLNSPRKLLKETSKDLAKSPDNGGKNPEMLSENRDSSDELKKKGDIALTPAVYNCSITDADSGDDFESNPIQYRTPERLRKKKLKGLSRSGRNVDKVSASPSSIPSPSVSGNSDCSEALYTPLQTPSLVSPTRSTSSVEKSPCSVGENSFSFRNKLSEDGCVRKLFDPLPHASNIRLSPSVKGSVSKILKNNKASTGADAFDDLCNSSQSQEDFGASSQSGENLIASSQSQESAVRCSQERRNSIPLSPVTSSQERRSSIPSSPVRSSQEHKNSIPSSPGKQRVWVRTPSKINQSIKSMGLLQNSPQNVNRSFISRKRQPSVSPEKPGSQDSLSQDSSINDKYNKAMFRGHKGYYLENFLLILETVLSEPSDLQLFDENDLSVVKDFHKLSLQAQKLYVRLFQRKFKWNRVSKIEYQDICDPEDMELYINELSYSSFLLMENELSDVQEVLKLLSAEEVKGLCKEMKLKAVGKKEDLVLSLLKLTKQQRSVMSVFSKESSKDSIVLKKAKELLGRSCIINKEVTRVFMRIIMLYGLPRYDDEDDKWGTHTQLTTLLMVNLGKMKFPKYEVIRQHSILRSREDLIRFEGCSQIVSSVHECLESQKWEEALKHCVVAMETYQELISDQELMDHDMSLPRFLRCYTSISLLLHVLSCSVECYQRLKNYRKAVERLEFLLSQTTHLQDYRGRWYDRLALNLDMHLKSPKALKVIQEALNDKEVRVGHRLALSIRAERMAASSRFSSLAPTISEMTLMNPREAPKVIIEGRSLPGDAGYKKVFIRQDSGRHAGEGDVTVCSVEELVLGYYKDLGYGEGVHREGTTMNSLFGLFFWDILYSPIPDVFRSPHQAAPLDLDDPHFYISRKENIEKRLEELKAFTEDEVGKEIERVWNENNGKAAVVAWDIFRSVEYAKGLVLSITLPVLASICRRLAEDHRFTRSGFPDLVVWDPVGKRSRIVEVKGPNDRLSTKQILWLDYLLENGADAEVCHVEAIGAKKMKLASPRRISPKKKSPKKNPAEKECDDKEPDKNARKSKGRRKNKEKVKVPENDDKEGKETKKRRSNRNQKNSPKSDSEMTKTEEEEVTLPKNDESDKIRNQKRPCKAQGGSRKRQKIENNRANSHSDDGDEDFTDPPVRRATRKR